MQNNNSRRRLVAKNRNIPAGMLLLTKSAFTLRNFLMEPVCQKDPSIRIPSAIAPAVIIMPL